MSRLIVLMVSLAALADGQTRSAKDLAAELRQMRAAIESGRAAEVGAALPDSWVVSTAEGKVSISARPLRRMLSPLNLTSGAAEKAVLRWLDQAIEQLEGSAPPVDDARVRLDRILAQREFSGLRPPSPWEVFRHRVWLWIKDTLRRIFALIAQYPAGGRIVGWAAALAAIAFLALWLFRSWTRESRLIQPSQPSAAVRTWEEWLRAALAASSAGELREAIHCAYWAAIARLQEMGELPADPSHTPREYLRALRTQAPAFARLTFALERFWYARQSAGPGDVRESLAYLEALGCRLN